MAELKEISEFERFYHEALRIHRELDLLIQAMGAMIFTDDRRKPEPVYIDPLTGEHHKIEKK